VHAPAWSDDGDATAATLSELLGFWEGLLTAEGLEAVVDCNAAASTLDETQQVRHPRHYYHYHHHYY
jgi:hypothetical protein